MVKCDFIQTENIIFKSSITFHGSIKKKTTGSFFSVLYDQNIK